MKLNLLQGLMDIGFLLMGAVCLVYLRLVRTRMRRLVQDRGRAPSGASPAERVQSTMNEQQVAISRDAQEMKALLSRLTMERSRLQVAFYDADRMIDDLEELSSRRVPASSSIMSPTPEAPPKISMKPSPPDPVSPPPKTPLSEQEKAVSWSRSGQSVAQIAEKLGRSEGEVELILGMARLSGGSGG